MHAVAGTKRARTDQAQEEPAPPSASAPRASTTVLEQQRMLAQQQLSEMVKHARSDKATMEDLQQRAERLRAEGEQQRDLLQRLMASGDMGALAIAAQRAAEVKAERERCEEQLATLQQGHRRAQTLAAVVEQQGVVADLLRLLVLQERVLAHDMSEEERLGVWGQRPEAGAAWNELSAELEDDTATDPLAAGWAEEERAPLAAAAEEEEPIVQGPGSGGGGGSSTATAVAAAPSALSSLLLQPSGPFAQALPQFAFPWALPAPAQAGPPLQARPHLQAASTGVSLLRWGTGATIYACALLVRDPRTGQEVERLYHEGMEQQLPERFKVKFTARMLRDDDPMASVPPGRSFLFLHHPTRKGVMPLLGVVEAAQLVHRSAVPGSEPHVYHLHVGRLRDDHGNAGVTYKGVRDDAGAMMRNTLVHHFGVSVVQANNTPVLLSHLQAMHVLHLPGGTLRVPA